MNTLQMVLTLPPDASMAVLSDTIADFLNRGHVTSMTGFPMAPSPLHKTSPVHSVPLRIPRGAKRHRPGKVANKQPRKILSPEPVNSVTVGERNCVKQNAPAAVAPTTSAWLVLVDGENVAPEYLDAILGDVTEKGGTAKLVKVFANFGEVDNLCVVKWNEFKAQGNIERWKASNLDIKMTQCDRLIRRKSVTDMHLAIFGMSALKSDKYIGLALVSSDSDFLPLISSWADAGKKVCCYGGQHRVIKGRHGVASEEYVKRVPFEDVDDLVQDWLEDHARAIKRPDGSFQIAELGSALHQDRPRFHAKSFGFSELRAMLAQSKRFVVESGHDKPPLGTFAKN